MCEVRIGYLKCGEVNTRGTVELCPECLAAAHVEYPQGWRRGPGDVCRHGTYVGNRSGRDFLCGKCEDDE